MKSSPSNNMKVGWFEDELIQAKHDARTYSGVLGLISTNVGIPAPEPLTEELFNKTVRDLMRYGETQHMAFLNTHYPMWGWSDKKETSAHKEKVMNKNIAEVYEKTADAVLVEKHLGHEINNSFTALLTLRANKDAYLAEAKARQEKADKSRSCDYGASSCCED